MVFALFHIGVFLCRENTNSLQAFTAPQWPVNWIKWRLLDDFLLTDSFFNSHLLFTGWKHHAVSSALWKRHLDSIEEGDDAIDRSTERERREKNKGKKEAKETWTCRRIAWYKTSWNVSCCNNSLVTNHHWFWKMSWIRLKFDHSVTVHHVSVSFVCFCHLGQCVPHAIV